MQNTLHAALLLLGAALASIPTSPSAVLIENNEVKVARALEKNQVVGKFHQHDMNRVMIYLQSGASTIRISGREAAGGVRLEGGSGGVEPAQWNALAESPRS
jgi:hypothetical protein